jgi:hypothetical protein
VKPAKFRARIAIVSEREISRPAMINAGAAATLPHTIVIERLLVLSLLFASPAQGLLAQTLGEVPGPARGELPPLPHIAAARVTEEIRIDGRLDDAAWAAATPATTFVQMDPAEGQPASERTEVRVVYDDHALYIGGRMFDREPHNIRARLARRDEPLWNADTFEIFIDSYHDRQTGFVFRITPAGAVRDAVWLAQGGGQGGQDNSWDAVWESAARIDSLGWTAELRIPFSQLRYNPSDAAQTWGIQFTRIVSRRGETADFAFTPKSAPRGPQRWATLTGLTALPRSRNLEVMPYVTSRAEYLHVAPGDPFRGESEYRVNAGVDLKYGLTSSLTLSATANPDFGQVEVDPTRVNLSANELFFPERRPFFVEGADIFRYGRIRNFNNFAFPTLFHSRRIGRPPQRQIQSAHPFTDVPDEAGIAAAVKLTGRIRPGLSAGILDALTTRETARFAATDGTQGREPVEPRTNYFVGRLRQDYNHGNTNVGLLATAVNRDLEDAPLASLLRRDAYFLGADFNQSWKNQEWSLDASLGRSAVLGTPEAIALTQRSSVHFFQRPDLRSDRFDPNRRSLYGNAWQVAAAKNSGRRTIGSLVWQGVSPGFEVNDVGFHSLTAYNAVSGVFALKNDRPGRLFRNWTAGPFFGHTWNTDGDVTDEYYGFHLDGRFSNFWNFTANTILHRETLDDRLTRGGPLALDPRGKSFEIDLSSDQRRVYSIELNYDYFDDRGGSRAHEANLDFTIRPSSALRVSFSPEYETARFSAQFLRQAADSTATATFGRRYVFGSLRYNEVSLVTRVDWTFSPTLSLEVFAQPLVADGRFSDFKALRAPRTFEFDRFRESDGTLTRDSAGWVAHPSPGTSLRIGEPDFSSRTLVGNAIMRWEYRPGSVLFFVWQQRRHGDDLVPGFSFGRDVGGIFREPPENVFAVKATYWIGR